MGYANPDQMLREMPARTFQEWVEFYGIKNEREKEAMERARANKGTVLNDEAGFLGDHVPPDKAIRHDMYWREGD